MERSNRVAGYLRTAAVLTAVMLVLVGCGDDGSSVASSEGTNRTETPGSTGENGVVEGLCLARRQAGDDAAAARATFLDTAHEGLHDLARELGERDRGAAAAVLEAKQQVEADLDAGDPGLGADLDELIDATITGYTALGRSVDGCETE